MTAHSTTIFTIGHGTDTFDAFLERIERHGVTTVVDVRSQPASRHAPDFGKRALEREAAAAGIGYRWLGPALGGRPADRELYDDAGSVQWAELRTTAFFQSGITELVGLCAASTVAVMCAELDPRWCHRSLAVAPSLVEAGFAVVDILHDGTTAPHQPSL